MKKLFGSYKPKWQQAMADPLGQSDNTMNELVSAARGQGGNNNKKESKKKFSLKPKKYKPRWQQMMADPDISAIQEPAIRSASSSRRRRASRGANSVGGESMEDISSIGESTIDDTASVISAASSTEMAFNVEERGVPGEAKEEITAESQLEKGSSNSTDTNTTLETTGSSNSSLEDPPQGGEPKSSPASKATAAAAQAQEGEDVPTRSGHSRNSGHSRSNHSSKFVPPSPLWAPHTDDDESDSDGEDDKNDVRVRINTSADDSEDSDIISVSTPSGAELSFTDDEDDDDEDDCSSASSESEALDKLEVINASARPQKQRLNLGKRNNWKYVHDKNEILEWKLEKERTAQRNTRLENQKETLRQLRKVAALLDLPFAPVRPTEEECTTETMMFSIIQEGQLGEEESVSSSHLEQHQDITFDMDDMDASSVGSTDSKKSRRVQQMFSRKSRTKKKKDDDDDASLGSHGSRKSWVSRRRSRRRSRRKHKEEDDDDLSVNSASSRKSLGGRIAGRGRSLSRTLSGGGKSLRRSLSSGGGLRKRLGKIGLRRSETIEC